MKTIAALIAVFTLISGPAFAGDWTREDTYREVAYAGLHIIDYGQTMNIAKHPDKYFEYNPIMGNYPSQQTVNLYMISSAILHPIISYLLPPKSDKWKWINRENWQYATLGIKIGLVGNNIAVGIGVSF